MSVICGSLCSLNRRRCMIVSIWSNWLSNIHIGIVAMRIAHTVHIEWRRRRRRKMHPNQTRFFCWSGLAWHALIGLTCPPPLLCFSFLLCFFHFFHSINDVHVELNWRLHDAHSPWPRRGPHNSIIVRKRTIKFAREIKLNVQNDKQPTHRRPTHEKLRDPNGHPIAADLKAQTANHLQNLS